MLIAMAVHDTTENDRSWMTEATLQSLHRTVDSDRHRLIVSDNGSCEETLDLYEEFGVNVILNGENLGTARAINLAWWVRRPGEHAVKMDNDVVIHEAGWADVMEDAFARDPKLGILGLKRNDLAECPQAVGQFHSTLLMLPHTKGQRWIVVEEVEHVIGTCQAYSSALLDRLGYLVQPGLYGFDDSLSSVRARVAGFSRAFLVGFEIDHLDRGGSEYSEWKIAQANESHDAYEMTKSMIDMGLQDVYYDGQGGYGLQIEGF